MLCKLRRLHRAFLRTPCLFAKLKISRFVKSWMGLQKSVYRRSQASDYCIREANICSLTLPFRDLRAIFQFCEKVIQYLNILIFIEAVFSCPNSIVKKKWFCLWEPFLGSIFLSFLEYFPSFFLNLYYCDHLKNQLFGPKI